VLFLKRFAGSLYNDIARLVKTAEADPRFKSGYERGEWVVKEFIKAHNEWAEWEWVINLLKEIAHAEFNKKFFKFPDIWGKLKELF